LPEAATLSPSRVTVDAPSTCHFRSVQLPLVIVVSLALKEMLYWRGMGDGRMVGEGVDVGIGAAVTISVVAVGLGGKVGNLGRTVGVGVLDGWGVGVGTRVLVAVGSAGVGVIRLAVGKDLGNVGVRMTVGAGKVGADRDGKRRS
jgi:hypothetical protein